MGNAAPNRIKSWSKIGIHPSGLMSEGVIIEARTDKGVIIRYGAIGLGTARTDDLENLSQVLYDTVSALH
jgi:hypothetical protein